MELCPIRSSTQPVTMTTRPRICCGVRSKARGGILSSMGALPSVCMPRGPRPGRRRTPPKRTVRCVLCAAGKCTGARQGKARMRGSLSGDAPVTRSAGAYVQCPTSPTGRTGLTGPTRPTGPVGLTSLTRPTSLTKEEEDREMRTIIGRRIRKRSCQPLYLAFLVFPVAALAARASSSAILKRTLRMYGFLPCSQWP